MSESYTALGAPDAPAIVFVHGTRLSRGMWHAQLVALSGAFRVVALDLPGHGSLRDGPFDWEAALSEIVRVVDEAAGGRAILVGLSLGGFLSIEVAARHPERIAGLVIAGASADPAGLLDLPIRALALVLGRTARPDLDRLNRWWLRRRFPAASASAILAGGIAYDGGADALQQLRGRRFRQRLASYPGPVLIVNGELDFVFRSGARRYGRAARDGRVVVLRRASHLVNLDRPSAFSALVARFAADVAGRGDLPPPDRT